MKIIRRIGINPDLEQVAICSRYGVNLKIGEFQTVDLDSDSSSYNSLRSYFAQWECMDFGGTEFSTTDYEQINFFLLAGIRTCGYPQPEGNFLYLNESFDLSNYCKVCGTGAVQTKEIQLKTGSFNKIDGLFRVNWRHDCLFSDVRFYNQEIKVRNIDFIPVVDYKSKKISSNIVQLKLVDFDDNCTGENIESEKCVTCGRIKYSPGILGFPCAPNLEPEDSLSIFKGRRDFGSGASAHNRIYLNREIYLKLKSGKNKIQFAPCKDL